MDDGNFLFTLFMLAFVGLGILLISAAILNALDIRREKQRLVPEIEEWLEEENMRHGDSA